MDARAGESMYLYEKVSVRHSCTCINSSRVTLGSVEGYYRLLIEIKHGKIANHVFTLSVRIIQCGTMYKEEYTPHHHIQHNKFCTN